MTTETTPPPAAPTGSSISEIFDNILSGIEGAVFGVILSVLTIFVPKMVAMSANDLLVIGNNFRAFLTRLGQGVPWGEALADMLTADWNEVANDAQEVATDFAEAVATALEKYGVLPQGK